METPRSVDLDGLDGIIAPLDKLQSKSFGLKAWVILFIVLAVIILFFMQNQRFLPLISTDTAVQTTGRASAEPSEILRDTLTAERSAKVEQTAKAATDNASMPAKSEVLVRSNSMQSQQESAIVQNQSGVPILPAESTAAGNTSKTAGNALFTVYFKFDSSTPIRLSEAETGHLIDLTKRCPKHILITGHTCNLGSVAANLRLGRARANAVKTMLIANGIAGRQIEAVSAGSSKPVASNDTSVGQASNRRAELSCLDQ